MILLLSDETWKWMERLLDQSDGGRALLAELTELPALPEDRELVRMARADEDPPEAVARARDARKAGVEAAAATREAMNELIAHIHAAGVGVTTLSRWFDLRPARIYEILGSKAA